MTTTDCQIDLNESLLPTILYLDADEAGLVEPAASYALAPDPAFPARFLFSVSEACAGMYRAVAVNDDGVLVGVGYSNLADTAGPFYFDQSRAFVQTAATVDSGVTLASGTLDSLFSDADIASLLANIQTVFENELDVGEASVVAIATAVRDALLDRVIAGNHEVAGSLAALVATAGNSSSNAAAVRDAILDRVLASNHETAGSVGATLLEILNIPRHGSGTYKHTNADNPAKTANVIITEVP